MGFTVFRTVMTVLICLFLLFLFWFPSRYLQQVADEAETLIDRTKQSLLRSDSNDALESCSALLALYDDNALVLERFLNHACIDSFGSAIAVAQSALQSSDPSSAYEALTEAESVLERILGIERFSPNSLL